MDSGRHKPPHGPRDSRDSKDAKPTQGQDAIPPGQVAVDNRGRNVWQFNGEAIDSTSMMLQRLDNPALALEPTRKTKRLAEAAAAAASKGPAGKSAAGKAPAGKSPAGAAQGRSSSAAQPERGDSTQSFEQRFEVKPGKNSGGGFDPYNRS